MVDLKKYCGNSKLENLKFDIDFSNAKHETLFVEKYQSNFFLLNNVKIDTNTLITLRNRKDKYPVGFNGLPNNSEIGSYRLILWNENAVDSFAKSVNKIMPKNLVKTKIKNQFYYVGDNFKMCAPYYLDKDNYNLLSSTPYIRYMEYIEKSKAKHAPHFDAPHYGDSFLTLFSWVLYLDDCTDGNFDFIEDGFDTNFNNRTQDLFIDFEKMSDNILLSITPKVGKMIIFPHWLCHQVNEFTSNQTGLRRIMRGDIAYGY